MDQRQQHGALAEDLAALYLQLQGIAVLQRNAACAGVQVDLLAREGARLLVVEVKLRRRRVGFDAVQSMGDRQHRRLRQAAAWMLQQCNWAHSVRIDVIGLTWEPLQQRLVIEHLRGVG
jgi:putative endonuclease